jgi:pimeloyl-ACP methyl ester carboxylesterase
MMRKLGLFSLVGLFTVLACGAPEEADGSNDSNLTSDACPRTPAKLSWMTTKTLEVSGAKLRVGTMGRGTKGDVLYLHGFADRFDNHRALFERFDAAGLRVLTFDYPSHGESCGSTIGSFGFSGLADLAAAVVEELAPAGGKPLYLSGWSTGGLLAVRMAQGVGKLPRPIAGMALFAPGVDVQTISPALNPIHGVTNADLSCNPALDSRGASRPKWVGAVPGFAAQLTTNEQLSGAQLPEGLPTLVIVGGDKEDKFVVTRSLLPGKGVVGWTDKQASGGATMAGLECAKACHELDNVAGPVAATVRDAAAKFLASGGTALPQAGGGCTPFEAEPADGDGDEE